MNRKQKPFGLLFEQKAENLFQPPSPNYDPETSLSYIDDQNGQAIPFVEANIHLATETLTEVQNESTDLGSDNTEVQLGTETVTATQTEKTDDDKGHFQHNRATRIFLSTETLTKADGEKIDDD